MRTNCTIEAASTCHLSLLSSKWSLLPLEWELNSLTVSDSWWPQIGSRAYFWSEHILQDSKFKSKCCRFTAHFCRLGDKIFTTSLRLKTCSPGLSWTGHLLLQLTLFSFHYCIVHLLQSHNIYSNFEKTEMIQFCFNEGSTCLLIVNCKVIQFCYKTSLSSNSLHCAIGSLSW